MVSRRRFLQAVGAGWLAAPVGGGGPQKKSVHEIGVLSEGPHPFFKPLIDALRQLGWAEGENLKFETRSAARASDLPSLATELVRLKVDLILTNGTPAARAAKEATKRI